jgi:hypothetical protein
MTPAAYRVYEQITPGGQMPPGLIDMLGAVLGIITALGIIWACALLIDWFEGRHK